jgi:GT2 family glycosyltransferase
VSSAAALSAMARSRFSPPRGRARRAQWPRSPRAPVPADGGEVGQGPGGPPAASRPVSVVVTTCGNTPRLERCLRSLLGSRHGNLEVIVVDNRPIGGVTPALLSEWFADERRIRYVEESRPGLSPARNAGLMAAEGALVAFIEDDVLPDPGWVGRAGEAFERANDVARAAGLILLLRVETHSHLVLEQFAAYPKGLDPRAFRLADDDHPLLPYTHGLIGSPVTTVVRADLAHRLGGFDTGPGTATLSGCEELDLYIRLVPAGHELAYEPRAAVRHELRGARRRLRRQVFR